MISEARRYLLSVGLFGWEDFDKKSSPFFDKRSLKEHVAAIVLAAYYLQPGERLRILTNKLRTLFPEALKGTDQKSKEEIDQKYDNFLRNVVLITSKNALEKDINFDFMVNTLLENNFNPPY